MIGRGSMPDLGYGVAGWQALEETGSRNKSGHDVFLTWDGIEIKGLDGVKRYCQETGIQLPKNLSTMPDIEVRPHQSPFLCSDNPDINKSNRQADKVECMTNNIVF